MKNEMVNLELLEFHYFDDILTDMKLTPVSFLLIVYNIHIHVHCTCMYLHMYIKRTIMLFLLQYYYLLIASHVTVYEVEYKVK